MSEFQEFKNRQIVALLVEKRYRFFRHSVFLIFFMLLISSGTWDKYDEPYKYYMILTIYLTFIIMFYINMYILIPCFLFKGRYLLYGISVIILVLFGLNFMGYFYTNYFYLYKTIETTSRHIIDFYAGITISVSFIMVTTTIKLLQRWTKDNERIVELKNLAFKMELNELKSQINPHFLFNMLNNVKALIRTNPEMAGTVIMKLSELLRYQLYENDAEKVALSSEIEFLSNFLNLEKIRRDNFSISIVVNNRNDTFSANNLFIPPYLFTVFVENAVKHSVDLSGKNAYIKVMIEIEGNRMHFLCANSKSPDYVVRDKKNSGLGLVNIKRRLELLYDDQYKLEIISKDNEYIINLIVPI